MPNHLLNLKTLKIDEKFNQPIDALHNLKTLKIDGCNGINFNQPIDTLYNLETLHLDFRFDFNQSIDTLKKLKTLILNKNFNQPIDALQNLETLKISHDFNQPINIGNSELVTINYCVDILENIAGVKLIRKYNTNATQGVRGRNSDNKLINKVLNWEPQMKIEKSFPLLYDYINQKINV